MTLESSLLLIIQWLVVIISAPLSLGILQWCKARVQGRTVKIFQPYLDLYKLHNKTASKGMGYLPLSIIGPIFMLSIWLVLCFMLPSAVFIHEPSFYIADLLLIIFIIGLSHFVQSLIGMNVESPLGEMGSSRAMYLHTIMEPTLIIIMIGFSIESSKTDLHQIITGLQPMQLNHNMLLLSLWLVILAEAGRLPFDNPATHLELTMSEKAIELEFGGRQLAVLKLIEALRLTFLLLLMGAFITPRLLADISSGLSLRIFLLIALIPIKLILGCVILGLWEITRAKLRIRSLINPGIVALGLAITGILIGLI